jgi:hypothetical protein
MMKEEIRIVSCSLLRLLPTRTIFAESDADVARVGAAILHRQPVVLERFVDDQLLQLLAPIWSSASFVPSPVDRVGLRSVETPGHAGAALCLALARPEVLRIMGELSGGFALTGVAGAIAQFAAGADKRLDWHDDLVEPERRLAITINLGAAAYGGGAFEFRDLASGAPPFRHVHATPGEALVFPIGPDLQHRVLPVTRGGPRTVFAGWFLGDAA